MKSRNLFCMLFLLLVLNLQADEKLKSEPLELDAKTLASLLGYSVTSVQIAVPKDAKKISATLFVRIGKSQRTLFSSTSGLDQLNDNKVNCVVLFKIEENMLIYNYSLGGCMYRNQKFNLKDEIKFPLTQPTVGLDEKGRLLLFFTVESNGKNEMTSTKENSTVDGAKDVFYLKLEFDKKAP